mmetsp:Transcript_3857/g.5159  ORF Transcript_3857/g.5159 Transcript_3857/m.5159 type:complete len:339 (+) Transcript_3857:3-1019(+)|eukprot:jgi/Bigna1/126065/aug1.2_g773
MFGGSWSKRVGRGDLTRSPNTADSARRLDSADDREDPSRKSLHRKVNWTEGRTNWDLERFSNRRRPKRTVREVPAPALLKFVAADLRDKFKIKVPEEAMFIKTGCHNQRAPMDDDWFYTRAAAVLRHTYLAKKWMSVGKLRRVFSGKQNRGHRPWKTKKAAGGNIRKAFQELVAIRLVEKNPEGRGHRITERGRRYLNIMSTKVSKMLPPLLFEDGAEKLSSKWARDWDEALRKISSWKTHEMNYNRFDEERAEKDRSRQRAFFNPETRKWAYVGEEEEEEDRFVTAQTILDNENLGITPDVVMAAEKEVEEEERELAKDAAAAAEREKKKKKKSHGK